MKVSVVIVSYNVKDYLMDCLRSVYASTHQDLEVIVVDNASRDGSPEAVRDTYPRVILLANDQNRGFPAANNQAFAIATGEIIFMLNPDAAVERDCINRMVRHMEQHAQVSLLAPRLLNTDGTLQQSVWRFPGLLSFFAEIFYLKPLLKRKNYHDINKQECFEAESFSGAAIMFRKQVLETLHGLDEELFWIEDVDFCYRAAKAGMTMLYFPNACAVHHISKSAKTNYRISLSNQNYNKIKFFKKHRSAFAYSLVVWLTLYHVLLKLLIFSVLSPFSITWRAKAAAYAYTLPGVFNPPKGISR